MSTERDTPMPTATPPAHVVTAVEKFLSRHGKSGTAVIQPVGRAGVRLTIVAQDGVLGDQMVDDIASANAVVNAVDDLETGEWDRELTSITTPAPGHYAKMAGWVAHQSSFPAARNDSIV